MSIIYKATKAVINHDEYNFCWRYVKGEKILYNKHDR